MNIPTHFRVSPQQYGTGHSVPYERGGPITSVQLKVPIEKSFTRKFGKRVKALGGSYDQCRGSYSSRRRIYFDWSLEGQELLEDILRFFESTREEKRPSIDVSFITDNGSYEVYHVEEGLTAKELVDRAADQVQYLVDQGSRSTPHFFTREEAEAYIAERKKEDEELARVRSEAKATEQNLIQAFNEAGFKTMYFNSLAFDITTSRRLIEFLKEHSK